MISDPAQAEQAAQQLPDTIDHEEHGGLLQQFGVDPSQLAGSGGQAGGAAQGAGHDTGGMEETGGGAAGADPSMGEEGQGGSTDS